MQVVDEKWEMKTTLSHFSVLSRYSDSERAGEMKRARSPFLVRKMEGISALLRSVDDASPCACKNSFFLVFCSLFSAFGPSHNCHRSEPKQLKYEIF